MRRLLGSSTSIYTQYSSSALKRRSTKKQWGIPTLKFSSILSLELLTKLADVKIIRDQFQTSGFAKIGRLIFASLKWLPKHLHFGIHDIMAILIHLIILNTCLESSMTVLPLILRDPWSGRLPACAPGRPLAPCLLPCHGRRTASARKTIASSSRSTLAPWWSWKGQ